jgi:hypothetical protein
MIMSAPIPIVKQQRLLTAILGYVGVSIVLTSSSAF